MDRNSDGSHTGQMRTPLRRWLRVSREYIALFRAVAETATILSRRPKVEPVIIPGRPEDFGR